MNKKDFIDKARRLSQDKKLRMVVETGRRALDIAYKVKQADFSGPLNTFGTILGATDFLSGMINSFDVGAIVALEEVAVNHFKERGLVRVSEYSNSETMYSILLQMRANGLFSMNGERKFNISDCPFLLATINGKEIVVEDCKATTPLFFLSPEITEEDLSTYFWEVMMADHAIALEVDNCGWIRAKKLDAYYENNYIGDKDPKTFVSRHKKYLKHGANRSFLFTGPPGTGKTTFTFKIARELNGRIMVINPDVLTHLDGSMAEVISCLRGASPKLIVFEDIDRASHSETLLGLFDQIRKVVSDAMIISTANNPERITPALKRPGRLGAAIEFSRPGGDEAKEIVKLYSDRLGVDRDISHLTEKMDHPLFTHDYIRDVCAYALVADDEELEEYIEFCKKNFDTYSKY